MRYQFSDFELTTERYELRRNGIALHVEPLVFDLILLLLRSPGRVVSREEMVERIWRGFEFAAPVKALDESSVNSSREQTQEHPGEGTAAKDASLTGHPLGANVSPSGTAPRPVLAVFPFANQSAEADDYFADGLTEDIVTNLARFRDLRVIAAGSTLKFNGRSIDVPEFCRQMRAAYVVQGNVRRAAGRIRITVQLIDGVSCVQLWGERYDRDMGDIFDLQDELTRRIAATLGVKMQDVSLERAMAKGPLELDSYDCVLRARRYTSASIRFRPTRMHYSPTFISPSIVLR
jgi:TolB-like protein